MRKKQQFTTDYMKPKKLTEPDYDFKLESVQGADIASKIFFSQQLLIIKCISGQAAISINSKRHEFRASTNFLLAEGVIFKMLECSDDFAIIILRLSQNLLNEVYPMLDSKIFETMEYSAPDLYSSEDMEGTDLIVRQLCIIYHKKEHTYRNKIVLNLIINYMFEIYEQTHKHIEHRLPDTFGRKTFLIDNFFYLLYNEEHSLNRHIGYYADKLHITSRYLHKLCKEALQMTPKQCIDYMVSGNAKKLLLTTSLTNQQIADELNFPDQATFGQFFKRNVGMSPSEFRHTFK